MPLGNIRLVIGGMGPGTTGKRTGIRSQSHGATLFTDGLLFLHQMNNRFAVFTELAGTGFFNSAHIAGKLDGSHLHSQADTKEGDLAGTGIFNGKNLTLGPALTETTRHQDTVHIIQMTVDTILFNLFRIDIFEVHPAVARDSAVSQSFSQ